MRRQACAVLLFFLSLGVLAAETGDTQASKNAVLLNPVTLVGGALCGLVFASVTYVRVLEDHLNVLIEPSFYGSSRDTAFRVYPGLGANPSGRGLRGFQVWLHGGLGYGNTSGLGGSVSLSFHCTLVGARLVLDLAEGLG